MFGGSVNIYINMNWLAFLFVLFIKCCDKFLNSCHRGIISKLAIKLFSNGQNLSWYIHCGRKKFLF